MRILRLCTCIMQSRDCARVLRNPEIAQIPRLCGTMVAQECTSTSRLQQDSPCYALCPQYVRTTPVVFLHHFRSISAIFPHCSRGISALLLLRSLSAPFPRHLRSLSALFPRYLRTVAAVLPHCSRGISAQLPQSFRCPSFSQELQYNYTAERSLCLGRFI